MIKPIIILIIDVVLKNRIIFWIRFNRDSLFVGGYGPKKMGYRDISILLEHVSDRIDMIKTQWKLGNRWQQNAWFWKTSLLVSPPLQRLPALRPGLITCQKVDIKKCLILYLYFNIINNIIYELKLFDKINIYFIFYL